MDLVINNLSKTYPAGVKALNNVSITIKKGMFGLLGPNGAGKSTLMRTIATLQEPDEGTIMLGDIDVVKNKQELRKALGYLPQEFGLYPKVNALTLLDHFAVLKGISNKKERKEVVHSLLEQVNLFDVRHKNLGGYSGGMKQRFGIAQALIGNPKLIIVDEPTAGLDPAERNRFLNLLSEVGHDIIVILSTHIVEDVNDICSDFAIINKGEVLYQSSPSKATAELQGKVWEKVIDKDSLSQYKLKYNVITVRNFEGKIKIHVLSQNAPEDGFQAVSADMEDVYFVHINKSSISREGIPLSVVKEEVTAS
jgi:ABC-2 type transport system ATP-binding protein